MQTIRLSSQLLDEAVDGMKGTKLDNSSFDFLIQSDADVYKPNGELLIRFRKDVLSPALLKQAQGVLRDAAPITRNRGMAAGVDTETTGDDRPRIRTGRGYRYRPILKSGELSKSSYAPPVNSGVVGYLDRTVRFPYCRLTEFGHDRSADLAKAMPLFREISDQFRSLLPDRWAAQYSRSRETTKDFVLPGTVFTTVTVNKNFQTAVHKDKYDLREGFGVLTVMERGKYRGGYYVCPQFRVAVDMRHGDLLLTDVHEFHGNTPILPISADYERLSLVLYYREKMALCGTLEEELERAKRRKVGDPLDRDP